MPTYKGIKAFAEIWNPAGLDTLDRDWASLHFCSYCEEDIYPAMELMDTPPGSTDSPRPTTVFHTLETLIFKHKKLREQFKDVIDFVHLPKYNIEVTFGNNLFIELGARIQGTQAEWERIKTYLGDFLARVEDKLDVEMVKQLKGASDFEWKRLEDHESRFLE